MTAEEMWKKSGLMGEFEAWAFSEAPDKLADLVKRGVKTATCSSFDGYEARREAVPKAGDYSVILDSRGSAVCVVKTAKVEIVPFCRVTADHAWKEGEGDRSLDYWRRVHEPFLSGELAEIGRSFSEDVKVVCEEFELIYP